MTIDEALAWADRPFLERIQLQMQGPPIPTDQEAMAALATEVRALRQRHAEAVEAAFREGLDVGASGWKSWPVPSTGSRNTFPATS